MTDDTCGWPTDAGHACTHPPTEDNGRCWLHADDDREIGRPSKFDGERARAAIQAARQSKSKAGCARAAEIDKSTLEYWIQENPTFETDAGDTVEFSNAFARARRDGETVLIQGGLRNNDVDTSMAKFLLATSFDYVKTERTELGTAEGTEQIVIHTEAADDGDD